MVGGVNPNSGQIDLVAPGVSSGGFGQVTSFAPRYNNVASTIQDVGQGPGWEVPAWPTMKVSTWPNATVMFQNSAGSMEYMKAGSAPGTYESLFGNRNKLTKDTSTGELTLFSPDGSKTIFNSLTSPTNPGLMKSQTSPGGLTKTLTGSFGANQTLETIQSYTSGGNTFEESFLQSFDGNAQLQTVVRRKRTNGGAWENIENVTYTYYTGTGSFGSAGDLKSATTRSWDTATNSFVAPKTTLFRYYVAGSETLIGFEHGVKFVVSPATWQKIVADGKNPETISNAEMAQYAIAISSMTRRLDASSSGGPMEERCSQLSAAPPTLTACRLQHRSDTGSVRT